MAKLDELLVGLVDHLVASLDEETGEWTPCWNSTGTIPRNAHTANMYHGINVLFLWSKQIEKNYTSNLWATYKQWAELGGQVRLGEKATGCVKWVDVNKNPEGQAKLVPVGFSLFNVDQQDGWTPPGRTEHELDEAQRGYADLLEQIPFSYTVGKPCYIPSKDTVCWPELGDFHSATDWEAVSAHELAHWTGYETRLARDLTGRFGDDAYAAEELIAEISAALTVAAFNLAPAEPRPDHAQYIKHWLKILKGDPKLLLVAAQHAQRATSFLLEYGQAKENRTAQAA